MSKNIKHSVNIQGHHTSVSLEPEFWTELKKISKVKGQSINDIIAEIDDTQPDNLSSAIRVYVLQFYLDK